MTLPNLAFAILSQIEGCRLKAYKDVVGIWTIGFGHTIGVIEGMEISLDQAQQFFTQDTLSLISRVEGKPLLEAAALISFGYNCGMLALEHVMSEKANIMDFVKAGKPLIVQPALVVRRRFEDSLIQTSRQMVGK